jgi:hypothetical protein
MKSERTRLHRCIFSANEHLQHVAQRAIEMTIWMSHPAVSLLIFLKHASHLRVDRVQISGYKLFSPWGL